MIDGGWQGGSDSGDTKTDAGSVAVFGALGNTSPTVHDMDPRAYSGFRAYTNR